MSERVGPEEIAAQIELRKNRLNTVIADITAVLSEDVPSFFTRQGKHAFLSNPVRAGEMSEAEVKSLKDALHTEGAAAAANLRNELGDISLWLDTSALVNDNKTLQDHEAVWSKVRRIEESLQAILASYDIATSESVSYKAPLYFVSGRYFPALAEHYWRLVGELQALEEEKGVVEAKDLRSGLSSKWDDA